MAWVLLPFTVLVALSRMVLGLHYPSDVLAGAAIGGALGLLSLSVLDLPGLAAGVEGQDFFLREGGASDDGHACSVRAQSTEYRI